MTSPVQERRGVLSRLYHGETEIAFVPRWRLWFALSGAVIAIGLVALLARGGLNLGLDFTGGSAFQVPANGVSTEEASEAVSDVGIGEVVVQTVGDDLRVETPDLTDEGDRTGEVVDALSELTGAPSEQVVVNQVGASWGSEISDKAIRALVVFLIGITIYITLRFELRMALATLAALFHDLLIVVGIYALLQLPVTPATVIAILTILGFSIYDGIVVFDRVDENTRMLSTSGRMTYSDMVDLSLNEVLMRSLNTQITALLPITSVLVIGSVVLGETTLQEFGLALFVGQLSGAYSSIFIASPALALLKEREPRYRSLRKRLEERGGRTDRRRADLEADLAADDTDGAEADGGAEPAEEAPTTKPAAVKAATAKPTTGTRATRPATAIPPRPRKKTKKRR